MRMFARLTFAAALLALLPAAASAQTSAIGGVVKDTSGAVLPGVTVEASSPALIEKVRSAVTDSSGQYKITSAAARHLHRHVHAARLQRREARERRADVGLHRDDQRRPESRRARRDDHRLGGIAGRRHAEHHHPHGHDARSDGRDSDRPQHPGGRHHDSRHLASRSAAAARCRATSAARATCSSRRCSIAARATRCRRSKGCG